MLKYSEVGKILSIIDSSSCDEVILEVEGIKLVVRRGGRVGVADNAAKAPAAAAPSATQTSAPPQASSSAAPSSAAKTSPGADGFVGAPMVGTFYRAPSPDAPPFVEVGTKVNAGDPICVIEVMKLFTTIHAEFAGTVTQIGAEDSQLVEFGQMIFVIDPS